PLREIVQPGDGTQVTRNVGNGAQHFLGDTSWPTMRRQMTSSTLTPPLSRRVSQIGPLHLHSRQTSQRRYQKGPRLLIPPLHHRQRQLTTCCAATKVPMIPATNPLAPRSSRLPRSPRPKRRRRQRSNGETGPPATA